MVSIVLPVYNGEKYISEAICSILHQDYKDWELIIVDDCSTDGTNRIVRGFATTDNRINVCRNDENCKMTKSLNRGFRKSKGKYVTWISDDNLFKPNALAELVSFLDRNDGIGMVYSGMDFIDENGKVLKYYLGDLDGLGYNDCVGACFLYRRECIEKIGEYDEMFTYTQDYEYWMRLSLFYSICTINKSLYQFRVHGESQTSSCYHEMNKELFTIRSRYLEYTLKHIKGNYKNSLFVDMCAQNPLNRYKYFEKFYHDEVPPSFTDSFLKRREENGKPIAVWGTEEFGKKATDLVGVNRVEFYIDSDPNKQGKSLYDKVIYSFEEYLNNKDTVQVMIAVESIHIPDIIDMLIDERVYDYLLFVEYEKNLNSKSADRINAF